MVMEGDADQQLIHRLRHSVELNADLRQREIIRHAVAHDLARLPIAGFDAVDSQGHIVDVQYDPTHPLEASSTVDLIYVTDDNGVAELLISPKTPGIKITNIRLSYDTDGPRDYELIPKAFQKDEIPEPYDYSHYLYHVKQGNADTEPIFKIVRVLQQNTHTLLVDRLTREFRDHLQRRVVHWTPDTEYHPDPQPIRSRYIPREARQARQEVSLSH